MAQQELSRRDFLRLGFAGMAGFILKALLPDVTSAGGRVDPNRTKNERATESDTTGNVAFDPATYDPALDGLQTDQILMCEPCNYERGVQYTVKLGPNLNPSDQQPFFGGAANIIMDVRVVDPQTLDVTMTRTGPQGHTDREDRK